MKARLIDFADEFQICGAKELYRTNFFIVRLVWIVIVCLGSLTAVWYVQKTIHEYNNSPTGTNVDFITNRWYHYPNIALCPNRWLDFIQMARRGISVEALKYSLGFVYIPTESRFLFNADDQGKGKVEFLTFIQNNTIVDYLDFYKLISKPSEQVVQITDLDLAATASSSKVFFEKQICYVINLPEHDCSLQTTSVVPLINVYFSNENNNIDLNLTDENFHTMHVNVDLKFPSSSGSKLTVYPQTDYVLKISSLKKFTRLNTKTSRCRGDDGKSLYSQNFCHSNCLQHRFMKVYDKCMMFGLFEVTTDVEQVPLCNSATYNLSLSEVDTWPKVAADCSEECIPPCTQNFVEISMMVKSIRDNKQPVSSIKIIYDVCAHGIMVFEQFERYTFENLIGDIGGLLGLWIGASIVSFVQVVMCLFELCVIRVAKQKLPV